MYRMYCLCAVLAAAGVDSALGFQGQEVEELPYLRGQQEEMPLGQMHEELPLGQMHKEIPLGQMHEELPLGQMLEDIPLGQIQEGFQQVADHNFGMPPQQLMEMVSPQEGESQVHRYEEHHQHEMESFGPQQMDQQLHMELPQEMQSDPHYFQSGSWGKALKTMKHFSMGSCSTRLTTPMNSALKCSTYSGCQATCMRGYTFPSGETQIFFVCDDGKWKVKGSSDDSIPQCKPTCIPPCQHGGTCASPNTCDCPEPFSGPYCQYEHKRCIGFPPTPNNARKVCGSESCTITCLDKHQFPDGSGIANVFCKEGEWSPARPDWPTIPDCKPVCIPECQNGGSCLAFNMCNCPQQFRGPYCQYSVDVCDFRKLNFNGNYNCSESGGQYFCSLSCPGGMDFQTTPSPQYTCLYSEGRYNPSTVPQCVFSGEQENSDLDLIFSRRDGGSVVSEMDITSKYRSRKIKMPDLSEGYADLIKNLYVLEKKTPTPGTCFTWAGYHYRTFDGRVVSFKSGCTYTLASDSVDNTFQVQSSAHNCTARSCQVSLTLYVADKRYQLEVNEQGLPVVKSSSRQWSVPSQFSDLRTDIVGYSMVATLQGLGVSLRWNLQDTVEVKVSEALWNKTGGLCGRMDGHATNDLEREQDSVVAYANRWQADSPTERCTQTVEEDSCLDSASQQAAHQFCNKLTVDKRYEACRKILPTRQYYEACRWDFCACKDKDEKTCACRSIAMFVRDCLQKGEKSVENWRDKDNCPVECSGGRVYKACGPAAVSTCMTGEAELLSSQCEEGCYCPEGMRLHNNQCIPKEQCPCYLRAKPFQSGEKVAKGCNTCECVKGKWVCTELQCSARCESVGDPHYQTFDGRRYNFMGKCSYYLLQTDNYTIDAENVACDGRISENMGFYLGSVSSTPSCTKAITIRIGENHVLKLKQNKEITINNEDVESLPVILAGAYVRLASSMFVQVEMPDGVEVWWDGQTRVYITAPPSLKGKTKGLCGTFNDNQKDDFLTPEGDVEQEPSSFADKWKTKESCDNSEMSSSHPCDRHVQNRAAAESYCANITSHLFIDCHYLVDPAPYYEDCLYDVCSCQGDLTQCLCPVLAAYAKVCSFQGAVIDWRDKIRGCGVQCPSGQQYQPCGSTCSRSCSDLARPCPQHWTCVEGCYCPSGQTLGASGQCVPITSCPCLHHGAEYPPSHKEIRPGTKALQFCECKNAVWQCASATPEQIRDYPNQSLDIKTSCSATRHQEYTHCEPPEPITCKNMHNPPAFSPSICRSGCVCRRGYVLDSLTKECVKPAQCPCHHGGQSYADGHKIQEDCNTCSCEAGKWSCSQHSCPAVCSVWGESHFRTFDNRIFDFQGACDYMLAKGSLSDTDSFNVALEIVPCGSSGVSCSKAVTLSVGSGDKHEKITFSANNALPAVGGLERIMVRQAGLFVFAEVADLGIVVQWDKGTRVILKADPKWKGRLKGLCGNYNGDEKDDFQTPSGGLSEVSAQLFGDSWKLQPYCPEARPVLDTCKLYPNRKSWAVKKCGILKSSVFRPCHSEVPIDPYLDRCIFDTCGCDQGGDCECLCTALAAYAHECNAHGVHIRWRTQQLCPVQCDETCSEYKPCIETCPLETCDNLLIYKSLSKLCQQDTCVEGCEMKPCPSGQVYHNTSSAVCVPTAECKPVCLTVGGKEYYEGDLMEGDDCYSCYCSRHKKTCTGQPCTSPPPTTTLSTPTPTLAQDRPLICESGWSQWISNDRPITGKKDSDVEPLPLPNHFRSTAGVKGIKKPVKSGQCSQEMMVDIECRTVGSGRHFKETMQDVECSLEHGLVCRGQCDDYEIRVLCQCGPTTTTQPTTTTKPTTESTTTIRTTEQTTTTTSTTPIPTTTTSATTQPDVEILNCDVLRPKTAHPSDCGRYYECVETVNGLDQLERECPTLLWFNPESMVCDWPDNVKHVRPECTVTRAIPECEDSWSEWVNVSHPASEDGDFETLSRVQQAGITLCPSTNGFIKDIQCQYRAFVPAKISKKGGKKGGKKGKSGVSGGWVDRDYKDSPDVDVMCSTVTGLTCLNYKQPTGQCQDYSIRVLCGCEKKNEETVVEKGITEEPVTNPIAEGCRSDQQWLDCNLQCDQLCLYYEHVLQVEGKCTTGRKCVPGCWPIGSVSTCPPGFRWREWGSCVRVDDCTCRSTSGAIVKPGEVIHESNCKVCICENNHYTCDDTACHTTITTTATTTTTTVQPTTITLPTTTLVPTTVFILPSTVSPPPPCDQDRLIPLVEKLPDSAFTASSSLAGLEPWTARITKSKVRETTARWQPAVSREGEYLQIDLGVIEPVYGVSIAGDVQHVTSYQLLFSVDNSTFSYVSLFNMPEVFRGSLTGESLLQVFSQPIEARYVRVLPQSWVGGISMSVELLGCGEPTTTESTTTTTEPTTTTTTTTPQPTTVFVPTSVAPVCTDEMGLDLGTLSAHQVKVSSSKVPLFSAKQAALSATMGWIPLLNSPSEWIQFDFLEERILTGVKTKGTAEAIENMYEPAWVTSYKVTYSHDSQNWNLILGPDHAEKVFLGNYDSGSVHTNYFDKPIHARYVRVYPNTWHNMAALRLEILGCFLPYPVLPTEAPVTTTPVLTTEALCNICEGAPPLSPCPCSPESWWDGEQCTTRTQCPCYIGHIPYAVGSIYDTEDCDQCICSLNGQPRCAKKVCPSCTEGLQSVLTPSCGCLCKPCPDDARLCPTSNVCINSTAWCDGVVDCPDDEVDCTTSPPPTTPTTPPTTTTTQAARITQCPVVECPEGFTVNYTSNTTQEEQNQPQWSPFGSKSKWGSLFKGGVKGGVKGGRKGTKGLPPHKTLKVPSKMVKTPTICPEYKCVPNKPKEKFCPVPKCADGYDLKTLEAQVDKCPEYSCEQRRVPDGKCNVTGRTIDTFDGTEYKYDICDHVLAQDTVYKLWQIKLKKICPYVGSCSKALLIIQQNHTLQFNLDFSILYDSYSYTVPQMQKIGQQTRDFAMKQVSDKFIIFASILDFTVVWDVQGNVKITVPGSVLGQVEGLCGYFDGQADNDRQKPDGSQARTTVEFGDSWGATDCETKVCPLHIQNMAWDMCSVVKKSPLNKCEGPINLDKALSLCVESVCACLDRNTSDKEACRCQALLDIVTSCQAFDSSVDLHTWRVDLNCPVDCPSPLVYRECYSRVCEPSCAELVQDDPCPTVEGECFPGCYCPDGLVREGSLCVKPSECRDCVCDGFGKTRFVTFDRVDFSFSGNCTHVLTKTLDNTAAPKFKVLATNGPCSGESAETCVKSLTLLYLNHTVHIGGKNPQQTVLVDGSSTGLPHDFAWVKLGLSANKDITVAVVDIQLDLSFHGVDQGFSLRLPSHIYKGTTEGLCGSCNNNQTDDFKTSQGEITEDADQFGKSWKAKELPTVLGEEEQCSVIVKNNNCTLPDPDGDLCLKLMDEALFGRCHAVVDPVMFVSLCHESLCRNGQVGCKDLEPYARECQAAGICLQWRSAGLCPYECPSGLQYQACGLGCEVTCDNVELYRKDPSACASPASESCVCPDNKVWKNNSCVAEYRCTPCDVKGHYPGDSWQPDICTTCSCQVGFSVQCQRIQCPSTATVCERGFKSITVQGTESDCCPKYICVPEPRQFATCPPPQQMLCGYGQVLKVETGPSGCQEFICQCLPSDECPDISDAIMFTGDPGMQPVVNTSGCCPRLEEVCKPETCPPPPTCPPFMEAAKRDTERCCLDYRCEPPKETCLYEMEYIDDTEGGERKRKPSEKLMVAKKDGESWQDGPCRLCECQSHGWRAKCTVQQCPHPPADSEFVIEAFPQAKQCCPEHKRVACRVGGKIYKEGEVFSPTDLDPCKNLTCLRSEAGELTLHETMETCNKDCPLGWEYTEPVFSSHCCGECRPVACVVNGTAHIRGSSWQSTDNCTTYTCDITGKQVQVISSQEQCLSLSDCPVENQYQDGCCLKCNHTVPQAHSACMPEALSANETVRLVRTVLSSHGVCENYDAIPNFTECQGTCDSYTVYNQLSERHDSQCQCCQPVGYSTITVRLLCEDGYTEDKVVSVPARCGCEACAEAAVPAKTKGKPSRFIKA